MNPPRTALEFKNFPGLVLAIEPHRLPAGAAQDQVNCMALDDGRLQPRCGVRKTSFEWSDLETDADRA